MINNKYIKRFISKVKDDSDVISLNELSSEITLYDTLKGNNNVFLLGSPGSGKSTELKVLFKQIWEEKESTGVLPFLIDLKIFRKTTKFEELIPYQNWKQLPGIIFLLDSLDEIADIQDFISELELFKANCAKKNIKFIIACRTNIYYSQLVAVNGFEAFQIQELNSIQVKQLLEHFRLPKVAISEILNFERTPFMTSPFFLTKLGELISEETSIPKTEKEIWDLYITFILNKQVQKDTKKDVTIPWMVHNLKRTALINELQHKGSLTEDELYRIMGKDYKNFVENPFYNTNQNGEWIFKHRQFQEYFVAKILSELSFDEIIHSITVIGLNKVHPSLFNVASFIIGIVEDQNIQAALIDWFIENDIEPLVKADPERVSTEIREKVFQSYFQNQCINKRLWISTNNSFSMDELGRFSNCKENSDYLISLIFNLKMHFRVRGSALNVLAYHDKFDKKSLLTDYIKLLKDEELSVQDKTNILSNIYTLKLFEFDKDFPRTVIDIFKDESNKALNGVILDLLNANEKIDDFFDYLQREFLLAHGIEKRMDDDDVIRGNDWKVNNLVLQLQNTKNFITLSSYYYDHYLVHTSADFNQNLLNKVQDLARQDPDFIPNLLSMVEENIGPRNRHNEELLEQVINSTETNLIAFKTIFSIKTFGERKWLLARIATEETIAYLIGQLENPEKLHEHLIGFRNILSNYKSHDMALYFVNKLKSEKGISLDKDILTKDEFEAQKQKRIQGIQSDFELLFNKEELISKVLNFIKGESISMKDYSEIRHNYFESTENYHADTTVDIDALYLLLRERNLLSKEEITEELEKDSIILKLLKNKLEKRKDRVEQFDIANWKGVIEQMISAVADSISTKGLLDFNDERNSFEYKSLESYQDYQSIKTIHYFIDSDDFNPSLSEEFLLDTMEYYHLEDGEDNIHSFSKYVALIVDETKRNQQIIENIKNRIFSFSWKRHVLYAINNEIKGAYTAIDKFFITDENLYFNKELFKQYYAKNQDSIVLEELLKDVSRRSSWVAATLLMEKNKVRNKARLTQMAAEYLENDPDFELVSYALKFLFEYNVEGAFDYYMHYMDMEGVNVKGIYRINDFKAVSPSSYPKVVDFFKKIHEQGYDRFDFSYHNEFLNGIISKISSIKEGYEVLKEQFTELKSDILKNDPDLMEDNNDSMVFYINLMLDNMEKSYIASLSQPLSFNDALAKTNEILPLS